LGTDTRLQSLDIALTSPTLLKEGENPVPLASLDTFSVDTATTLAEPSLFLSVTYRPIDIARLIPSVRLDYYSAIDHLSFDPRILGELEILETTTLRAGFGLYQQPPQPDEFDDTVGNPELGTERSVQASLGVEQKLPFGLSLGLTGFYKWLDELVVRNPALATNPTAPLYTNDGTGRILGLEALLRFDFDDVISGWVAYTFQRSFRTDAAGAEERVFDFDQPHILTALATWNIGAGWSLGARWRLVSGNPFAPVTGSIYDAFTDVYVPVFARTRSRLPAFHQLDVRLDKTWTFDAWKLNLYLDVQNVYNRENPEGQTYSYDYSESQLLSGLPILPIFGIRGDW
jgi:outer membrane receptor for ferrienterochelin and colicin